MSVCATVVTSAPPGTTPWLAADAGFIGMSMANDIPSVAAPGSRGAITGSNPFAYAVPAGRYQPMLLDMSVATVAGGKVYAARERGESIPSAWLVGPDGLPTDDADCVSGVGDALARRRPQGIRHRR